MVKNIAIIPARSGSKRVPNKNILDFFGKPMMAYTIEAALKSGVFDTVMVSTDTEEYAEIAIKYGAEVPFLREECNDDFCTLRDVTAYVLKTLKDKENKEYDNYASLQVSCPLVTGEIIKNVYDEFTKTDAHTMSTCFEFNFMNPWWAFKMNSAGEADYILSSPLQSRSQDNPTLYCPSGAVFFSKVTEEASGKPNLTAAGKCFQIDWKHAVDIDNWEDIEFAKAVYLLLNQENKEGLQK